MTFKEQRMEKYLEAAKIVGTHALKGEVRVQVWCNSTEQFCSLSRLYFDKGKTALKVKSRQNKNAAIVKIEGIDDVSDADTLRGKILYLDRNDIALDENEYFIQDIIGLCVKDIDRGKEYGVVTDVFNTGANDIYTVKTDGGNTVYIPVIDEIVKTVDAESGKILIKPMKGLFDDED